MRSTLLGGLLQLAACRARTQLVVVVDTDLRVPEDVDEFVVEARGPSGATQRAAAVPAGTRGVTLPQTLSLVPDRAGVSSVTVTATARKAGRDVVSRAAHVDFVADEARTLRLDLLGRCRDVMCPDEQTCGEALCQSAQLAPESLAPWTMDAGPPLAARPRVQGGTLGVMVHGMRYEYAPEQWATVLDRVRDAHLGWVRVEFGWAMFEPSAMGVRDAAVVARAEAFITAAATRGLRVLVAVQNAPPWANGTSGTAAPPREPADAARFVGWLAERYRGRVAAWEIWPAPNAEASYGANAAGYAALLRACYPAIKRGDPAALVVTGGTLYNDTPWLTRAYAADWHGAFDVLATVAYQSPADAPPETPDPDGANPYVMTHVAAVHALMVAQGDGDKPIWFTEFGWSSHPNTGSEPPWERGVTRELQGDYLVRALQWIAGNAPYVTQAFWSEERDRPELGAQPGNRGLLATDFAPKPAYLRLQTLLAP